MAQKAPSRHITKVKSDERSARGRTRDEARFTAAVPLSDTPPGYGSLLIEVKERLTQARLRTVLAANASMVLAYWEIGRVILARQQSEGWGAKVIDRLSEDLRKAFPEMKGLSPRNLKYMRTFAAEWPEESVVQGPLAQMGSYQNIALLFYRLRLRRYIVIELKNREFEPGDAGQMNLYLSAVDDLLKHDQDQPSIGLLLCRARNKVIVEYALRGMNKPIGLAKWETDLVQRLPRDLQSSRATVAQLEAELSRSNP